MKIAVGLSGGVDSAVAALLLQQAGHEVVGITMSIWQAPATPSVAGTSAAACSRSQSQAVDACYGPNEKEDIALAQKIADILQIPYHVLDCAAPYQKIVLDYFKDEYLAGRTPNPCVFCNSQVKFGVLLELARQSGIGFDKFATGHYARIEKIDTGHYPNLTNAAKLSEGNKREARSYANVEKINNRFVLKKARDAQKDQTYFLYRLKQEQLAQIIFPLGDLTKDEVRKIARENNLPVSAKPDSQDFYSGDYSDLIGAPDKAGNIVDASGKIWGTHNGYWHFTIGQRKGLGVAAERPLYVLDIDAANNEVIVGYEEETLCRGLLADNINWLIAEKPERISAQIKIRSAQQEFPAEIIPREDNTIEA
ncbi:MAG: tRNA 2-thiouridine(34) synthase MnmA, partial [Candidatus Margulisbacteria bacterium]|nr:tRNA 2-thiouridine(34) synthase MnmA [Candidatus Margulisiibacteriota bacterium]